MTIYTYNAYGLKIASTIELPELIPNNNGDADVRIRLGKVPEKLESPSANGLCWQSEPGKLLLSIDEIGRYLLVEDREVVIEPDTGTSEDKIRKFLLGSILGALLYSRNIPVIHSSVIKTKRGAVLFMGKSGAGKSTLLAAFLKRGYEMLADDKAGIFVDKDGVVRVLSAFPAARMMKTTVKHLDFNVDDSWTNLGKRKYVMPVEKFSETPTNIYAAYSIKPHNKEEIVLNPLEKFDRFQNLNRNTYRRRFLQQQDQKKLHLHVLSKLSEQAKVIEVFRPNNPELIDILTDKIEEDFSR